MKKTIAIICAVVLVFSFTANSLFAGGASEVKDDQILIGGSIFTLQYAWFLGAQIGMENWAEDHPEANVRFQFEDAMQDVQTNIQVLENLATAGAKGIVIFPVSSTALIPTMVQLHNNQDIKFVVGDYAQEPEREEDIVWETFVGHDMVALGEVSGEIAVDYLDTLGKDDPTLLFITVPTSGEVSAARLKGFQRVVLESYPNARIIVEGDTGGGDRNSAQSLMENVLQREAVIDVVAGHNDAEVLGAYNAAVGADRDAEMKFIGIAGDKEVLRYLADGNESWLGEVLQDPVVLGYTAMEALWASMNGEDLPDSYELPKPEAITKENIASTGWENWKWL
ncbi:MAG: sugar ABC transporter substrate-binding protein [Sphaerochaetaceae bacterium]